MLRLAILLRSAPFLSLLVAFTLGTAVVAHAAAPPLSVPQATLDKALDCKGLAGSSREVVIFVHGTSETPAMFDWNWFRYADQRKWPRCSVALPEAATADAQTAAEYLAYGVRRVFALTGRRVQILGHSQGGMLPRWVLKYWPDTRAMVDDVVGLAASNHGTQVSKAPCASPDGCAESFWQQTIGSHFLEALNSGPETFAGISYTSAFTRNDEIVVPNQDAAGGSTALRSGAGRIANVLVQDICPGDGADHLAMGTYDSTAYAIAVDALDHDGPADPARVDRGACSAAFMPGVDPAAFPADYVSFVGAVANATGAARRVPAEPALRCYVKDSCPAASTARAKVRVTPNHLRAGRKTALKITGSVVYGDGRRVPATGSVVTFAGRRLDLDSKGRAHLTARFAKAGLRKAAISSPIAGAGHKTARVLPAR
jgi:hypothetical protein